jgi:hypothetical protein
VAELETCMARTMNCKLESKQDTNEETRDKRGWEKVRWSFALVIVVAKIWHYPPGRIYLPRPALYSVISTHRPTHHQTHPSLRVSLGTLASPCYFLVPSCQPFHRPTRINIPSAPLAHSSLWDVPSVLKYSLSHQFPPPSFSTSPSINCHRHCDTHRRYRRRPTPSFHPSSCLLSLLLPPVNVRF